MLSSKARLICLVTILVGLSGVSCVPPGGADENGENDADFRAGMGRKQAGNYARAIESFERTLQRNPQSAAAHFELGLIYYQNVTNYVAAIYHFDRVERLQPSFRRIDVVRELIKVCKQEMVRDAMGGFTVQMQREMERLERLAQENAALRQENAQLQAQVQRGLESSAVAREDTSPSELATPTRNGLVRVADLSPGVAAGTGAGKTYTVKRGDTLFSIARRHRLSEATLRAANPGVIPTRIVAGQVLRIPAE